MSAPKLPKRTIKNDPFADLIPDSSEADASGPSPEQSSQEPKASISKQSPKRAKITVVVDGELVERIKNAAYWNPALTVASVTEMGIRLAMERIEKDHGGPYPTRTTNLRPGRPLK